MHNRSTVFGCLVAIAGLFMLGPAQMIPASGSAAGLGAPRSHAPMIHIYGPDGVEVRGPHNEHTSGNWSGYALSTSTYTSATINWVVPTVTFISYASTPGFESSSNWVGIGGFDTSDLIQLGTEQYVESNGTTIYRAWYELLPASETILSGCTPVSLSSCPVSPGDTMTASLSCTANCTASNSSTTWALAMTDSTKGWSWSGNFTYESCLCSAEWIEEAPTYTNVVPMPNYGEASFYNLTVNGGNPNLVQSSDGIILHDHQGSLEEAGGTSTPCAAIGGNQFLAAWNINCPSLVLSHNLNGDDDSDIFWRSTSGGTALWLMNGGNILQSGGFGTVATTWSVVGQRDFSGNGNSDLLWRDSSGDVAIWLMNGLTVSSGVGLGNVQTTWSIVGTGDLNGDGVGDLLWRDTAGDIAIWYMGSGKVSSTGGLGNVSTTWTIVGDDNNGDILWHDSSGNYVIWRVSGSQVTATGSLGNVPLATWQVAGIGDFNGDGYTDILWRDTAGDTVIWFLNSSLGVQSTASLGNVPTTWSVAQTGDYNGDGNSDILWIDNSGNLALWFMNGGTVASTAGLGNVGTTWTAQSLNAE